MTIRQKRLLEQIIDFHIKTNQPVSSKYLAKKYFPKISSATIRNEMARLTRENYLSQLHISAGRLPTEKSYLFWIKNFLKERKPNSKEKKMISSFKIQNDLSLKNLAKAVTEITKTAAIVAFDKDDFYCTGFSYLFNQPEFKGVEYTLHLSKILDKLDEGLKKVFQEIKDLKIFVGENNPFGPFCSSIILPLRLSLKKEKIIFALLGPIRMDYNKNFGIMKYIKESLSS